MLSSKKGVFLLLLLFCAGFFGGCSTPPNKSVGLVGTWEGQVSTEDAEAAKKLEATLSYSMVIKADNTFETTQQIKESGRTHVNRIKGTVKLEGKIAVLTITEINGVVPKQKIDPEKFTLSDNGKYLISSTGKNLFKKEEPTT